MRLFHVSEEKNIERFIPRIPYRADMDKSKGLVWSLTEPAIPNWLTPRDCPRVGYRANEHTSQEDIQKYFSSSSRHCVAIEHGWHNKMIETTIYMYEFDARNFYFDNQAGFYVSEQIEIPVSVTKYDNLYEELFKRNVEIRILSNLWALGESVQSSSLTWSLCRMANAIPKECG